MKHISIPANAGDSVPFYLSVEEWVARHLPEGEYFFAWQVPPTVICGRHQDISLEVDRAYARRSGIEVWRRKSGGGAVYADRNNIMFSYIAPCAAVQTSFGNYTSRICEALRTLGIEAAPTGRNDIAVDEKTVAGNAYYTTSKRSIVHGTMLFDADFVTMGKVLTPARAKVESKGVKSVPGRVTTLRAEGLEIDRDSFIGHIVDSICGEGEVCLGADDLEQVREIMQSYLSDEFLADKGERDSASITKYVEGAGLITFRYRLDNSQRIVSCLLKGDFFTDRNVDDELCSKVIGVEFTAKALRNALKDTDLGEIVHGLSTETFLNILTPQI